MRQENADFGGQVLLPWVVGRPGTEGPAKDLRPQGLSQQQPPSPLPASLAQPRVVLLQP